MGFFKTLFGGTETPAEQQQADKQTYNFEVLTYDGAKALRLGQPDYAIACLTRALDIHDDEDARINLAQAYVQTDRLDEAAEQYAHLAQLAPDNAGYPLAEAELLFQLERYDALTAACQRALEIDATLAMPHHLMAKAHLAQRNLAAAQLEATAALTARPDYAEARLLRATILLADRQPEAAEADVDALIQAEGASDDALLLKAQIRIARQDAASAIPFCRQAIEQNPFMPTAYSLLRQILLQLGANDEAAQLTAEAIEQLGADPDDPSFASAPGATDTTTAQRHIEQAYNAINPFQLGMSE